MVSKEVEKQILAAYEISQPVYEGFVKMLLQLLGSILHERGITVHSITGRPKEKKSLVGKLSKNSLIYEQLTDLTDLAGLRVITYFAEDVDRVAQAIEEEFYIDRTNSIDKRLSLEADRFGYLSMHHVLLLNNIRSSLPEYKAFKGMKAEVQTRSILQHAWAEIEHDLGYKSSIEVPQPIRRRFARIASLLELADDEFNGIKHNLLVYREEVANALRNHQDEILLNLDSFLAFLESSEVVQRLDATIARNANRELNHSNTLRNIFQEVQDLQLKSIAELGNALIANEAGIICFAKTWLGTGGGMFVSKGISVYYLWLFLISEKSEHEIQQSIYPDESRPPGMTTDNSFFAARIQQTGAQVRAELAATPDSQR